MNAPKVVVVGGGLAGIQAALAAADRDAAVTLLERRAHLGGLTWSFEHDGLWFDNGQHVFLRCCTAYRAFVERIGGQGDITIQDRLHIPVLRPGHRMHTIGRAPLPAPLHLGPSLASYGHLSLRDRVGLIRAALALRRVDPDDPANDEVTFGSWLRAHGQSTRAIEALWDLITRPTLNLSSDQASLGLAAFVFRTGLLERADAADIGYANVPLRALHDERARAALDRAGVDVRLGERVEAIEPGPIVVTESERLAADAVIVALDHLAATRLLPEGALVHQRRLAQMPMSAIVNVHLVFDRRITDLPMAAAVGSPVEYVFDRTEASGLVSGQYLVVSLSAAERHMATPPKQLISAMASAVQALYPQAARASLTNGLVTRERFATFAAVPGTRELRPLPRTAIDGVFLAGAWTATGWPATMEGAVRSGTAAVHAAFDAVSSVSRQPLVQEVAR